MDQAELLGKLSILKNQSYMGFLMHCLWAVCSLPTRWGIQVPGIFSKTFASFVSVWWGSGCWKQVLGAPPHSYLQAQENLSPGSSVRPAQIKNGSRTGKFPSHSAIGSKYLLQILEYRWFLTWVSFWIIFLKPISCCKPKTIHPVMNDVAFTVFLKTLQLVSHRLLEQFLKYNVQSGTKI